MERNHTLPQINILTYIQYIMPFYYHSHGKDTSNHFVAIVRRIYNPLGFYRGYNFPLWIIFGLGALGFSASRAMYLDYDNTYKMAKVCSLRTIYLQI